MVSPAWIKGIVGLSLVVTVATTATIGLPKKPNYKGLNEEEIHELISEKCGYDPRRWPYAAEEQKNKYKLIYEKQEDWQKCYEEMLNEWMKVNDFKNFKYN